MQFVRFVLVGSLNTAIGFLLIIVAMRGLKLDYRLANATGYAAGCMVSFLLHRIWTFRDEGNWRVSALRWVLVVAICYGLNFITLTLLRGRWNVNDVLAQLGGVTVYCLASFAGGRLFAFRNPRAPDLVAPL